MRFDHGAEVLHQRVVSRKPEPEQAECGDGEHSGFDEFCFHAVMGFGFRDAGKLAQLQGFFNLGS